MIGAWLVFGANGVHKSDFYRHKSDFYRSREEGFHMLLDLYTAFNFDCVPTGIDVAVILHVHIFITLFFSNKLHIKNDSTALKLEINRDDFCLM